MLNILDFSLEDLNQWMIENKESKFRSSHNYYG